MIKLEMGERSRESAQKRETPRVIADAMHRKGVARPLTFSWSGCSITRTEPCTTGCQHHTSVNSESKKSDARDVHSQGVFNVFDKSLAPVQWVSYIYIYICTYVRACVHFCECVCLCTLCNQGDFQFIKIPYVVCYVYVCVCMWVCVCVYESVYVNMCVCLSPSLCVCLCVSE